MYKIALFINSGLLAICFGVYNHDICSRMELIHAQGSRGVFLHSLFLF